MASGKVWRDAATLILTARTATANVSPKLTSVQSTTKAEDKNVYQSHFDYSVLMLKRSSKSKFMPNAFVFPGGVLSSSDSSSVVSMPFIAI